MAPHPRLRPLLQRAARHDDGPHPDHLQNGRAAPRGCVMPDSLSTALPAAVAPHPGTQPAEPFRTAAGGRIDRGSPVRFRFDGTTYSGLAGDTLASALLANGVH